MDKHCLSLQRRFVIGACGFFFIREAAEIIVLSVICDPGAESEVLSGVVQAVVVDVIDYQVLRGAQSSPTATTGFGWQSSSWAARALHTSAHSA